MFCYVCLLTMQIVCDKSFVSFYALNGNATINYYQKNIVKVVGKRRVGYKEKEGTQITC